MSSTEDHPIEWFKINGLHGYKDVRVDFPGKSTIVIADNGMGKTAVLNALNYFLSCRIHRLAQIDFSSIECKFNNSPTTVSLAKPAYIAGAKNIKDDLDFLARSSGISENLILDFIKNEYSPGNMFKFMSHRLVRTMYTSIEHDWDRFEKLLDGLYSSLDEYIPHDSKVAISEIQRCIGDVEVDFFPTYRRVERLFQKVGPRHFLRRQENRENEYEDMVFGLSDVEERLFKLGEDVARRSNASYRSLSAHVLKDMLVGDRVGQGITRDQLPEIESLGRFLNRVENAEENGSLLILNKVKELYDSNQISSSGNSFLRYFLSQLSQVIEKTKEIEQAIEKFTVVCNSYFELSNDEKKLTFNPETLQVSVKNTFLDCEIPLNDLSSGEKQIISLMARIYLGDRKKIVLIDEPEISLSIEWQRKILPDISEGPMVSQLMAITHSPFVFDNYLDEFAQPFKIERKRGK